MGQYCSEQVQIENGYVVVEALAAVHSNFMADKNFCVRTQFGRITTVVKLDFDNPRNLVSGHFAATLITKGKSCCC